MVSVVAKKKKNTCTLRPLQLPNEAVQRLFPAQIGDATPAELYHHLRFRFATQNYTKREDATFDQQ